MTHSDYQAELRDNQANWNDRAKVHLVSDFYDVEHLIADPTQITDTVQHDYAVLKPWLPQKTVAKLDLLHLQCHIGTDTLSWQRLGATHVTGLDFSPQSLEYARQIADRANAPLTYVEGDARFASQKIQSQFDVIVTSMGTITWLPELTSWAQSIAQLLRAGGTFLIRDDHPFLNALDFESLVVHTDYFNDGVLTYDEDGSYTDHSAHKIQHTTNHNWNHDFQELTSALCDAGLTIEFLGEYDRTEWPALPDLIRRDDWYVLPESAPRIPLTFALVVKKPA
ncbi:class I SAM-dependent methyltransferase [Levilactobacillus tujiorum]|uniref:class I SAM-dependent methyltransferase n=1 Tax=Levilactobacillus tujiorum TaxID=2912243 RepID=UPI001456E455|nr:class I SAM-dependent methyltransferase [Levilactobacillus tujiorum]NLR32446.1 class I SAM-dependent methyltransferase [Levilactobacillus tujiorum]